LRAERLKPLAHEFRVGDIGIYARAVFVGQLPAYGVEKIAPKIGPGAADVRTGRVHGASFLKEDAEAVLTHAKVKFVSGAACVGGRERLLAHAQMGGQAGAVSGGEHNAPGAVAAVAAAAALESGRPFLHVEALLAGSGVILKGEVAGRKSWRYFPRRRKTCLKRLK